MNVLRNINLQRTIGILVLLTALFSQIQTLYACSAMADSPKHVCCCGDHDSTICPMIDSCSMHEKSVETACCELSYDVVNDAGMMNSTATVDYLTLLLDGPQPPPIVSLQQFSPIPLPSLSRLLPVANEPPILNYGKPTYLLTRRLRL